MTPASVSSELFLGIEEPDSVKFMNYSYIHFSTPYTSGTPSGSNVLTIPAQFISARYYIAGIIAVGGGYFSTWTSTTTTTGSGASVQSAIEFYISPNEEKVIWSGSYTWSSSRTTANPDGTNSTQNTGSGTVHDTVRAKHDGSKITITHTDSGSYNGLVLNLFAGAIAN